jgi:signal transduction histidine kinase
MEQGTTMKTTQMEILAACQRSGEAIDEILRQADQLALRTRRLAELLRSSWPSSPLYACFLEVLGHADLAVVDGDGDPHPEWAEPLRILLRIDPAACTPRKAADLIKLPPGLKLSGYALATEEIRFRAHCWGVLALAVPKQSSGERLTAARLLLTVCSGQLAARLEAEARDQECRVLQQELAAQFCLASTGELAGPLAHEFNNFLNIVLLHVALLGADIPAKLRAELTQLQRQGTSMTALVKQFQQYRRRRQPPQQPVDLNEVIRDTARALTGSAAETNQALLIKLPPSSKIESAGQANPVPLELILAPHLPSILGSAADMRRLCTFLLTNAAAAAAPVGGKVTIQTEARNTKVVLRVEDTGPSLSAESLNQLFEPAAAGRAGTNSLELAACETLVRRWQGKIYGESRPGGGLILIVDLLRTGERGALARIIHQAHFH